MAAGRWLASGVWLAPAGCFGASLVAALVVVLAAAAGGFQ